jgi:surface carbohydrate biosynthesis protein
MARGVPNSLLIPVETLNRELDGKLLLALFAAARGMRVILGGRQALHERLPQLPTSIYLAKGIRTGNRVMFGIAERLGHVIVALDEEALIRPSDEALLLMFDPVTFNRPRLLYAWGRSNADVWRRYPGYRGAPILEVGNPRVDVLLPRLRGYWEPEVEHLRARHGRFVLLSTNFSSVNHFIPDHVRFRVAAGTPPAQVQELRGGLVGHKAAIFEHMKALVPKLAAAICPAVLVIRPHPSENARTWQEVGAGHDNVRVEHEGPIGPWLMAAAALVHNGCTSGVEAAILGTPAFAYRPVTSAEFDPELPHAVSTECATADELVQGVVRAASGAERGGLRPDQQRVLSHHIASLEGPLSCERILDSLAIHRAALAGAPAPTAAGRLLGRAHHLGREGARAIRQRRRRSRSSAAYLAHKFPGLDAAHLAERIERFRAVVGTLPALCARPLYADVFAIEKV